MTDVFIAAATRTPFGRYGGRLAALRCDDLAAAPLSALISRYPNVDWASVDEVILGCANQAGEDNRNVARMATLLSGLPETVPAVTVNRLCASGLEAVGQAARTIACGEAQLVIAGGVESMSRSPFVMAKADTAFGREQKLEDTTLGWRFVNPAMQARYGVDSMTQTADNLAREHDISRNCQDAYAWRSQQRTAHAQAQGWLAEEIAPVQVMQGRESITVKEDEHPRPNVTPEQLAKLEPLLGADSTITAGNASGLNDGACALCLDRQQRCANMACNPWPASSVWRPPALLRGSWVSRRYRRSKNCWPGLACASATLTASKSMKPSPPRCLRVCVVSDWLTMLSTLTVMVARSLSDIRSVPAVRVW